MSAPASRPDLLRLLAQSIFGEQARLFPWEERKPVELDSTRPAELKPAQRERPSDLRDMNMSELERLITEQEEAQREGAAAAIHNMPASPVAGLVAAASPDTYANMANAEGPGGEAPTMAAALTGLETTGGPGHPLTPRVEGPAAPGGRVRPAKITGIPLPDPRMKGMPIDHLKNEHTARWWDKFERAQEQGPVALEKARDAAKKDWDARFRTWQISNEPPQQGVVDQDFVIPSEGSATGVTPTMFQPAREARPARPAGATASAPKPEKPKFIDPSAVSVVTEPMPEPPPGGITVEPIEGKPGTWRIRDPKSGLEQEFVGDRETADKHAKWLAQLSLRAEAREKLKAAKAAEKPKDTAPAKPAEPEPAPAKPAEPEPPISDAEAAKLIEARNQPEPGFEQDPTPERVAEMMRPDLNPASPGLPEAEALVRRTAELQKKQVEGTATPEEIAEINSNINTNRADNAARTAPPMPEPPMTTGGGSLAPQGLPPTRGQRTPKNSPPAPIVGRRSSKPAPPAKPTKPPSEMTPEELGAYVRTLRSRDSSMVEAERAIEALKGKVSPEVYEKLRRDLIVGTGTTRPKSWDTPATPSGPPGESSLNRTLGLKFTPPSGKGRVEKDYAGRPHTIEPWTGIEPAQKKQMLKNKDLFDRILAGAKVKESDFPANLRGPRKSEPKLDGPSVQEYLKVLGKDVEDVSPASINWDQYNARQNAEFGSRTGLKPKPEGPTFSPAPEPPADTTGADAFHAKLMGALEKKIMGKSAGDAELEKAHAKLRAEAEAKKAAKKKGK